MIFGTSLGERSHHGECLECADTVLRVLFPGIPVLSLDGEEACVCTCTKAALADYPCSRCLVPQNELHNLSPTQSFQLRTTENMKEIYEQSLRCRYKKDASNLLQRHGLHQTEVRFIVCFLPEIQV